MNISPNVKIYAKPSLPAFLQKSRILSIMLHTTAQAAFGTIYLPKKLYDDLRSEKPDHRTIALIIHEQTHLQRQKEQGTFKWLCKYLLIPTFRLDEEIMARKKQIAYLKEHKLPYPIEQQAKVLSSWLYLWPAKYETALQELKKAEMRL